eukprot:GDKK01064626.1.p1 GENE.GDKK01064626.1~~GDKK01064626.1.p1  ORF type:complete len:594 (+),score=101.17 GDKK01064626.1:65-1783(+)
MAEDQSNLMVSTGNLSVGEISQASYNNVNYVLANKNHRTSDLNQINDAESSFNNLLSPTIGPMSLDAMTINGRNIELGSLPSSPHGINTNTRGDSKDVSTSANQKEMRAVSDGWMMERRLRLEAASISWLIRFMCIKGLVFFIFWQGVGLRILQSVGVINVDAWGIGEEYSNDKIREGCNFLLICMEMLLFAILHFLVFEPKSLNESLHFEMMVSSLVRGLDDDGGPSSNPPQQTRRGAFGTEKEEKSAEGYIPLEDENLKQQQQKGRVTQNVMFGTILTTKGKTGKRRIPAVLPENPDDVKVIIENQAMNLYEHLRVIADKKKLNPLASMKEKHTSSHDLLKELVFEEVVLTQFDDLANLDEREIYARLNMMMSRLVTIKFQREVAENVMAEKLRASAEVDDIFEFGVRAIRDWDYHVLEQEILDEEKNQNEELANKLLTEKTAEFDRLNKEIREEYILTHSKPKLPPNAHYFVKPAAPAPGVTSSSVSVDNDDNYSLSKPLIDSESGKSRRTNLNSPSRTESGSRTKGASQAARHHRHASMLITMPRETPVEYGTFRLLVPGESAKKFEI